MSYEALRWAMSQPVAKSSAKFVLVAMADCVNGQGDVMVCWPTVAHLSALTALDRKTVIDAIQRLRDSGFILDTKERKGSTGQIPVYRLKTPETGTVPASPKGQPEPAERVDPAPAKSPENGIDTKTGTVPLLDAKSPVFPHEESRFSLETVPKTGHGTRKEPGKNQEGTRKVAPVIKGVPPELLDDWLAVRKAKRAGPLTPTAIAGLQREADKAGLTAAEAIAFCCEAGWQGFNAGWYADRTKGRTPAAPSGKHSGFAAKNYREGVEADGSFH